MTSHAEKLYRRSPPWLRTILLNAYALGVEWHRFGPRYRRALARLGKLERADRETLTRYQMQHLGRVLEIALARSEYYKEAFALRGLGLEDFRTPADLAKLPLLEKETVRNRPSDLMTRPTPRIGWLEGHTSGTTGSPLAVWYDRDTCVFTNAVDRRQKRWGGVGDRDWVALLLGRMVVPVDRGRPPFWHANHVQRQLWLSSFHMRESNLGAYVDEMRRRRIRFLEGYPSTLYVLAKYLERRGETVPLTSVFSSSETLLDLQRETIERAFEAPLFDFYGHAERTIFAMECEAHDGKHLAEEFGIVEVVDAKGVQVPDGELGYLVGTSLHNTAFPLIRYRTGDITRIRREPCACGRSLLRIDDVTTKAEDIVVTPDGRMISPSVLTHPFKPYDQIRKSQLIQDRVDHLQVLLVADESFDAELQGGLVAALRERLGPGIDVDVSRVAEIPLEPSGKFRWVISRVDHAYALAWNESDETPPPR